MRKFVNITESIVTPIEPRRASILGEECLVEVRFVESRSETTGWLYEYEVSGEVGKVEKFFVRVKDVERKQD
jgi:hypothetical protein